jgi:glycine C-acetyltransferase
MGGASGGCVSGRRELVEMCHQRARPYLFSNSVPPVIVAGALKVLDLITSTTERRDKLEWNDAKLAQDFARDLFQEGVYAVGFFFPVVPKGRHGFALSFPRLMTRGIWTLPSRHSRRFVRSTAFWA